MRPNGDFPPSQANPSVDPSYMQQAEAGALLGAGVRKVKATSDRSPVEEKLAYLSDEIEHALANMGLLAARLQPILTITLKPDVSEESALEAGCELESRLQTMYQRVRGLNARIKDLRDELRI